jgi:hypothetical protein
MEERWSSENHWTLDPSLRRYFLLASLISAAVLTLGVLLNFFRFDEAVVPLPLRIAGGVIVGLMGAVSALFLWRGMSSYWWQVDRRTRGMNLFWLLAFSVGNWIGAMLYYFFVWRRIPTRGQNFPTRPEVPSA